VLVQRESQLELGADAIGPRHQHGLGSVWAIRRCAGPPIPAPPGRWCARRMV
jgi:hypothetical protein